jgi:hypothetical protein
VERDFSCVKGLDVQARPVRRWLAGRVSAHLFLCLLAVIVTWRRRQAWAAPDVHRRVRSRPLRAQEASQTRPRRRRQGARPDRTKDGQPLHSFHSLLQHVALISRNPITFATPAGPVTVTRVSQPTPVQKEAFRLIDLKTIPDTGQEAAPLAEPA